MSRLARAKIDIRLAYGVGLDRLLDPFEIGFGPRQIRLRRFQGCIRRISLGLVLPRLDHEQLLTLVDNGAGIEGDLLELAGDPRLTSTDSKAWVVPRCSE